MVKAHCRTNSGTLNQLVKPILATENFHSACCSLGRSPRNIRAYIEGKRTFSRRTNGPSSTGPPPTRASGAGAPPCRAQSRVSVLRFPVHHIADHPDRWPAVGVEEVRADHVRQGLRRAQESGQRTGGRPHAYLFSSVSFIID